MRRQAARVMMMMVATMLLCGLPGRCAESPLWKLDDDTLVKMARAGDDKVFQIMRVRGNAAHKEVLREIAENYVGEDPEIFCWTAWGCETVRVWAKIQLVWWGEDKYLDEFGVGLSTTNLGYKYACLDVLRLINNRAAVRYMFQVFDENEIYRPLGDDHVMKEPPSYNALSILQRLVPNPPIAEWRRKGWEDHYAVEKKAWRQWWEKNKKIYEKLSVVDGQLPVESMRLKEGKLPVQP